MPMRSIFLSLLACVAVANAEHFNFVVRGKTAENVNHPPENPTHYLADPIQVPSGAILTIHSIVGDWVSDIDARVTVGDAEVFSTFTTAAQRDAGEFDLRAPTSVTGPASVRFFGDFYGGLKIVCYSIETAKDSSSSNAAVVPDDNSGDHQVILEASADLKTWEPVQPGNYPATTTRRFFRVRVQKQ